MQKFYISKRYIPNQNQIDDGANCQEIYIPDSCQHEDCNKELKILQHLNPIIGSGNRNYASCFEITCDHYFTYNNVWVNRLTTPFDILSQTVATNRIDPIDDGCKCNKCGLWSFMASPNQIDNTFKCYSCRNRGW